MKRQALILLICLLIAVPAQTAETTPGVFSQFLNVSEQSVTQVASNVAADANYFSAAGGAAASGYVTNWQNNSYQPDFDTALSVINDAQQKLSAIAQNTNYPELVKAFGNAVARYSLVFNLLSPVDTPGVASSFDVTAYSSNQFVATFSSLFSGASSSPEKLAQDFYNSAANIRSNELSK